MRIDGYSYDVLKQISPQKIRLYLTSCGWELDHRTNFHDVFINPRTNDVVTVPNSRDYTDYAYRVEEIVSTVSESDNVSVQRVITGMTISSSSDCVEYHYNPENGEIGLIPIPDMMSIIETGNDINNFAFRDLCEFKPSYSSSSWKGRKELEGIRIGPTIPGSYVVQFIYPIMEGTGQIGTDLEGHIIPDNINLCRLCDKIESSLGEIIEAAERYRTELDPELNISHNFVSSVMDLSFENAYMDIRRIRTLGKKDPLPKSYTLSKTIFPRISAIENNMRPREMTLEQDFIGRITKFKDPREAVNEEPAEITIAFIDKEGRLAKATFSLSGEDLDKAYDAAKSRSNVQVSGTLTGGRYKRIVDIKSFKVLI